MESSRRVGTRVFGRAQPVELIALLLALEERDHQDDRDRRRFDREVGARLAPGTGIASLLRGWLEVAPSNELSLRIARVRTSLSLLRGLLMGAGIFLGWAAVAALLQFEVHTGRINIVLCVGLLVVLPIGMLVLGCLAALLSRRGRAADRAAMGVVAGGWGSLALGRLVMRLLPESVRRDVEILLGRLKAHTRLYARVRRAQLFLWSQSVGLSFATGAIVATFAFVLFTDLAFGWSTTLDVEARSVHRLVSMLSTPWSGLWPEASPSLNLVETTRYFRAAGDEHLHLIDPILYGGWWPFLVASLLFYSWLPRLITTGLASRWLSREVGSAIALTPGLEPLLSSLTTPIVETQATGPEAAIGRPEVGRVPDVIARDWIHQDGDEAPTVVRWAEASDDAALVAGLGMPQLQIRDAGGLRTLREDADLVAAVAAGRGGVAVCVKAFEPPILDLLDFLTGLRRSVGPERALVVLLVGGSHSDHEAWRHKLVGLGDPGLRVALLRRRPEDPEESADG